MSHEAAMPTPGFEGFEKRLEVEFFPASTLSLRSLSREKIDSFLNVAECTIVSQLSNAHFDSYVLSESSLFIYPHRIVIKTCGTTRLLKALPHLLAAAASIGLTRVVRCKYTRGSFLFPEVQPFPHRSFDEEVRILDEHFGALHSSEYVVMGGDRQKWHVYVASEELDPKPSQVSSSSIYTLEVCMTELDKSAARSFFKSASIVTGDDMTRASGINLILPGSQICDFAFDPCGYSMNGLENGAHSTIHITPEDGFSYASFESMGYDASETDLNALIDRVVRCFKPGFFSVSVHAAAPVVADRISSPLKNTGSTWDSAVNVPVSYACNGSFRQELPGGSSVVYHTFRLAECVLAGPTRVLALDVKADEGIQKLVGADGGKLRDTETSLPRLEGAIGRESLIGSFEGGSFILSTRTELVELLRDRLGSALANEDGDGILIVANSGTRLTDLSGSGKISKVPAANLRNHLGSILNRLAKILNEDTVPAVLIEGETAY